MTSFQLPRPAAVFQIYRTPGLLHSNDSPSRQRWLRLPGRQPRLRWPQLPRHYSLWRLPHDLSSPGRDHYANALDGHSVSSRPSQEEARWQAQSLLLRRVPTTARASHSSGWVSWRWCQFLPEEDCSCGRCSREPNAAQPWVREVNNASESQ